MYSSLLLWPVNRVTSMISKSLFSTTFLFCLFCLQVNASLIKTPVNYSCATVERVVQLKPQKKIIDVRRKDFEINFTIIPRTEKQDIVFDAGVDGNTIFQVYDCKPGGNEVRCVKEHDLGIQGLELNFQTLEVVYRVVIAPGDVGALAEGVCSKIHLK